MIHLAVTLTARRFSAPFWVEQVHEAQRALLDFVTLEDDGLDAVVLANRLAPVTEGIGLVPVVSATVTEPFLVSTQLAPLDFVSRGRAGVEVRVDAGATPQGLVGPRPVPPETERAEEAREYIDVVRRLWDSWEDGAEIRDAARQRFFDVDKVHSIDFAGHYFRVAGPSITPHPPQGQPVVLGEDVTFTDVVVNDTPARFAEHLLARDDGPNFRLHADDLHVVTRGVVPALQARGAFRTAYEAPTLRGLLGLDRPANRYAA
jgi:alkanesulfonate monooxygenase SsuD/methylene tetrahydromethanopterin reductase-like flavin-dependent oxidoreductase (luciferase family)